MGLSRRKRRVLSRAYFAAAGRRGARIRARKLSRRRRRLIARMGGLTSSRNKAKIVRLQAEVARLKKRIMRDLERLADADQEVKHAEVKHGD